jgi:hypothetical protein
MTIYEQAVISSNSPSDQAFPAMLSPQATISDTDVNKHQPMHFADFTLLTTCLKWIALGLDWKFKTKGEVTRTYAKKI